MTRRHYVALAAASMAIFSMTCNRHTENQRPTIVNQLSSSLRILERYQVKAYRDQSWCKNVVYARGQFSNNLEQTTCNLFAGQPVPFDTQAQADFDAISTQLSGTGLLYITEAEYDEAGRLSYAQFHLDGRPIRSSYIYAPGYGVLPESLPNEMEYSPINEDWYYQWMDWN